MKFHEIHGSNISLDESKQKASRTSSFCDAIVFSDNPIRVNSFIPIKISSSDTQWLGSLFLGVTTRNPYIFSESSLPKHILGLYSEEDFWIKSIPSHWMNSNITIHLTFDGLMEVMTNDEPNVVHNFLTELPVDSPLWLILDLYGSSNSVQFSTYQCPMSSEMLLLGPDMSTAFKCGADGVVPYNQTRIMLIGPNSSGKSSLKMALINTK
jgi:protein neuralized